MIATCVGLVAAVGLAQAQAPQLRRPNILNRRPGLMRPGAAAQQQQQEQSAEEAKEAIKNAPKGTNGVPALVFNQAPLELVLDAYAEQCGKTIIPAPDLPKSTITLKSLEGQLLTKDEYLEAIEVTLTMNGVVLEPFGEKFLRALQRKTLRTQGNPILMRMPEKPLPEKGKVVSQMIRLENITAEEAQKAIEGFKDPNGLFQVFERTNTILVTDTQENVNRMLEVIKELDVATPVTEDVFVRQIEYAVAADIKTALETIVTESQKDTQKETSGAKTSGGLGFGKSAPAPQPSRLLNLNNRPGAPRNEPPANTPNVNLVAAVSDADRGMIRGKVLILADERSNKLIVITNKSNMDFFDKVIKTLDVETTPEVEISVIRLKYADSEDVASMLNDLIGASGGSSQQKNNQNANTQRGGAANSNLTRGTTQQPATAQRRVGASNNPTFQNANASRLGELNKDNVKVLSDKRINGIVIMARKADMRAIKDVVENMDVKLSQVLIETVIIEISLDDGLTTGIDWVQRGRARVSQRMKDGNGRPLSYMYETATGKYLGIGYEGQGYENGDDTIQASDITFVDAMTRVLERDNLFNHGGKAAGYMLGGGAGTTALGGLFDAATSSTTTDSEGNTTTTTSDDTSVTPIGNGINYILKSDKLNLAAIIQASKTDTRAKYIASPIVMTVDNKEAQIDATENRQFLTGWTSVSGSYAGSSMPSPNYSAKDIGIKIKVTPKINPNGTVMLTVEEEYSRFVLDGQSMLMPMGTSYKKTNVDLAVERKMSADVRLENMQTVVFGGLTETSTAESESGIPILKDIPWIGKWLFGSVSQSEARKELLVFMTPYVLDDEESAQFEALRRKKALSDPRPWDDHGWSASPLADPVSRREQLRRFNDEWAKQDEERKTKLAIERAKMERAKKLEEMSKAEREEWLKVHKDVLEKEEREAFEEQVKEQEDLREFVDDLKRKDMEKAEKAVRDADAAAARDNEYRRLLKEREEKGQPQPSGETLKRDAEALKKDAEAERARSGATAAETADPNAAAQERVPAKPAAESPKPAAEPAKPDAEAPKPTDTTKSSAVEEPKSSSEAPKPAVKPAVEAPKPITSSKPVAEVSKPVVEAPKPVAETPKPASDAPKTVVDAPKRRSESLLGDLMSPKKEKTQPVAVPQKSEQPKGN